MDKLNIVVAYLRFAVCSICIRAVVQHGSSIAYLIEIAFDFAYDFMDDNKNF